MSHENPHLVLPADSLPALLDALDGEDAAARADAETALRRMGPDAVKPLLSHAVKGELVALRHTLLSALTGLAFGVVVLFVMLAQLADGSTLFPLLLLILWGGSTFLANRLAKPLAARLARERRRSAQAERRLQQTDDVRAVGAFAEALGDVPYALHPLAEEGLLRLLPRLAPADDGLLGAEARRRLYLALQIDNARQHPDLLLAIMGALERLADTDALHAVRALANAPATSPNGLRVREAARACLRSLEERAHRARQAGILLRPAEAPPDTLLRPVAGAPEEDAGRLLRPVGPGDNDPQHTRP